MTAEHLTVERLDELDRLLAEALPGPWQVDDDTHIEDGNGEDVFAEGEFGERGECYTAADAQAIVAARNYLPYLTAEVRRLRGVEATLLRMLGYEPDKGMTPLPAVGGLLAERDNLRRLLGLVYHTYRRRGWPDYPTVSEDVEAEIKAALEGKP